MIIKMNDNEKDDLAERIVDRFWQKLSQEVGGSLIKKALWGLLLFGLFVVYIKWPFK